jgi:hypothetical protein
MLIQELGKGSNKQCGLLNDAASAKMIIWHRIRFEKQDEYHEHI